jgi:hypothetical protein
MPLLPEILRQPTNVEITYKKPTRMPAQADAAALRDCEKSMQVPQPQAATDLDLPAGSL